MAGFLTWLRTVARVRPSMVLARARRAAARTLFPNARARRIARAGPLAPDMDLAPFARLLAVERPGEGRPAAIDMEAGTLRLLGIELPLRRGLDWRRPDLSRHARHALHSFAWIEGLAGAGDREKAYALFRELVSGWLDTCPPTAGDAWEPWPVSLRAVSWLRCAAAFRPELGSDEEFARGLAPALYSHGAALERDVEWHLRCNHVMENARALVFLGSAFGDRRAARWLTKGRRALDVSVREQFLSDGCHVERSPMYHLIVLERLLDCVEVLHASGSDTPAEWVDALARGAAFARATLHPDGGIALVNDSALGEAREAGVLTDRVRTVTGGVPAVAPWASAFASVRAGEVFLLADGGAPSPAYNPGHSHAGALSYELSLFGRRAVTDSGAFEYAPGPTRDRYRATRAHNTVCVSGGDQSEIWSAFRVGGRARCSLRGAGAPQGAFRVAGRCAWSGSRVVHSREWVVWPGEGVLVLDSLAGTRGLPLKSAINISPFDGGWSAGSAGGGRWEFASDAGRFFVHALAPWRGELERWPVSREFGREERAVRLTLRAHGDFERGAYFIALRPRGRVELASGARRLLVDDRELHF